GISAAIASMPSATVVACSAAMAGTDKGATSRPAATESAISQLSIFLGPMAPFLMPGGTRQSVWLSRLRQIAELSQRKCSWGRVSDPVEGSCLALHPGARQFRDAAPI